MAQFTAAAAAAGFLQTCVATSLISFLISLQISSMFASWQYS